MTSTTSPQAQPDILSRMQNRKKIKEGEEKGGLPTVVITLVNEGERERIDLQSAHIFSGVRGFDHNELSDFVTTAVPPVCAPEKKNEQSQTGAAETEQGQK